jgi:hypothetical protein
MDPVSPGGLEHIAGGSEGEAERLRGWAADLNVGERLDEHYRPIGPAVRTEVDSANSNHLHLGVNEPAQVTRSRGQTANEYSHGLATGHDPEDCMIPFGVFRSNHPRDRDSNVREPTRGKFAACGWNGVRQVVVA